MAVDGKTVRGARTAQATAPHLLVRRASRFLIHGGVVPEELGRLPLALEQAAAYLDRSRMPAVQYLALLRTRAEDLYRRGTGSRRDVTIETVFDLSINALAGQNPAAVQLLDICAHLAPEPIPLDLFSTHTGLLPDPLAAAANDDLEFVEVVTAVVDYSLAKRTPSGLQLHRLVQAALRTRSRRVSSAAS